MCRSRCPSYDGRRQVVVGEHLEGGQPGPGLPAAQRPVGDLDRGAPGARDGAAGDGRNRRPDAVVAAAEEIRCSATSRLPSARSGSTSRTRTPAHAGPGIPGADPERDVQGLAADVDGGRRDGERAPRSGAVGAAVDREGPVGVLECAERGPVVGADVDDTVDHTDLQPPGGVAEPARDREVAAPAAVGGRALDAPEQHRGRAPVVPGRDEDPLDPGPTVRGTRRHSQVGGLGPG